MGAAFLDVILVSILGSLVGGPPLGFLVALAKNLTAGRPEFEPALKQLTTVEQRLERARLAREDTLGRESMSTAERRWLETNRSPLARHWNLLTGLTPDQLSYAP